MEFIILLILNQCTFIFTLHIHIIYEYFTEVTSIRSGLRKRKRPESPQSTEPQVTVEWVDEDKLELWEIKQYGDRYIRQERLIKCVSNNEMHVVFVSLIFTKWIFETCFLSLELSFNLIGLFQILINKC